MTSPHEAQLCAACGGPMDGRTTSCIERPGALTFVEMYDQLVLDDVSRLDTMRAPSCCADCRVDADRTHHIGCQLARCGEHPGPRTACGCDGSFLAEVSRIPWRDRLRSRLPRLRWPRLPRRRFRPGEEITRYTPNALPAPRHNGRNP